MIATTRRGLSAMMMHLFGGAAAVKAAAPDRSTMPSPGHFQPGRPWGLSAADFGAVGDGRNDDTAALQAFVDAVAARGERGFIPAGTYRITAPLRIGAADPSQHSGSFCLSGAGRTGPGADGRAKGGTLILYDGAGPVEAVVQWQGSAWRDCRFGDLGLASSRVDGATYGLLIRSSEVSHLAFDNLRVENVRTAFGLLQGTGFNGEFCTWSHIQTWNVLNFFFSDAGQAYGLRFNDSFCYYRAGGTLFELAPTINGGGLHLSHFDASPVQATIPKAPRVRANTTLFRLSGLPNAPLTVIGGRFEHLTTILDLDTRAANIILHSNVQFVGVDFTIDLDRAGVAEGLGTLALRHAALADVNFLNCNFSPAFPGRGTIVARIQAEAGCRGNVHFVQCGLWGLAEEPGFDGARSPELQVGWSDCTLDAVLPGPACQGEVSDYACRAMGGPYNRRINPRDETSAARIGPRSGRLEVFDGTTWQAVPRTLVAAQAPFGGRFLAGDMCRNPAPQKGQPILWLCIADGEPGEWLPVMHL